MIKKLYYEFQLYTPQDYEDGVVASSSAAVDGHSGGPTAHLYIRLYDKNQGQDNERDSEESDANVGKSSGHPESSLELDPEDLNTSAAGVARIPQRHQGPQKRFRFTRCQIQKMERVFKNSQYPDLAAREELARALNVPEAKLKVWFANRRAKERKKKTRTNRKHTSS